MVLGLEKVLPGGIGANFNLKGLLSTLGPIFLSLLLFGLVAIIITAILLYHKNKKLYKNKCHFFEGLGDSTVPIFDTLCAEIKIPGTSITVFYSKEKNMYLPRPVKRMTKDSFWFAILKNREIINFSLKNINREMKDIGLDYDHTDMRYGNQQLRDLIKRNYRDKSLPWWREYKDLIATVIFIFVMTLSLALLIWQLSKVVSSVGTLLNQASQIVERTENLLNALKSSGVVSAGP